MKGLNATSSNMFNDSDEHLFNMLGINKKEISTGVSTSSVNKIFSEKTYK